MAKKTTLDDLARMVKVGFDQTATKEEVRGLEERVGKVGGHLEKAEGIIDIFRQEMEARFEAVIQEIKQLRENFQMFISIYRTEIADLRSRIERLEKKVGIKK